MRPFSHAFATEPDDRTTTLLAGTTVLQIIPALEAGGAERTTIDIAAALAPIEDLALPESVKLERADKETAAERALPESIPSDVLVRLDASDIALERAQEEAA